MKKKLLFTTLLFLTIAIAGFAFATSRKDTVVKHEDSCGCCKPNGPSAFICGQCHRPFSRVTTISQTDEYDIIEYSHKGHSEEETCQHTMLAKLYK